MKAIIKYNDKFLNSLSWFMKIGGITLFPYIILREKYETIAYAEKNRIIINHESIHIKQQTELLVIGFYIWYIVEWFIRLFMKGSAYSNISFEKEAKLNEKNLDYIKIRKKYSFIKYI